MADLIPWTDRLLNVNSTKHLEHQMSITLKHDVPVERMSKSSRLIQPQVRLGTGALLPVVVCIYLSTVFLAVPNCVKTVYILNTDVSSFFLLSLEEVSFQIPNLLLRSGYIFPNWRR